LLLGVRFDEAGTASALGAIEKIGERGERRGKKTSHPSPLTPI
jgi:hypothetical protein